MPAMLTAQRSGRDCSGECTADDRSCGLRAAHVRCEETVWSCGSMLALRGFAALWLFAHAGGADFCWVEHGVSGAA